MSELLLRRRALEAINLDVVEGGGDYDGKNIVILSKNGWNTRNRFVSTDFGKTFLLRTQPDTAYTHSADLDCKGGLFMPTFSVERVIRIYNPSYTTASAANYLKSGSTDGSRIMARAIQVSSDMSKALVASGKPVTSVQLLGLSGTNYTTASILQSSTNVPFCVTGSVWQSGMMLEANRDTLQHVIIGNTIQQRWGLVAGPGCISHDWGLTWNNIAENIEGVSHSIGDASTNKLRSVAWSADGKYCGVVYDNKFYLSQDSGYHFTSMSCPETPRGIFGSQKFKTLYFTAVSGSIYRSKDKGSSWTKIYNYTGYPASTFLTVNDKGDKLWFFHQSGSALSFYASYSHDYGDTWSGSKTGSTSFQVQDAGHSSFRYFGSRDHCNVEVPTPPAVSDYSSSITAIKAALSGSLTTENNTLHLFGGSGNLLYRLTPSEQYIYYYYNGSSVRAFYYGNKATLDNLTLKWYYSLMPNMYTSWSLELNNTVVPGASGGGDTGLTNLANYLYYSCSVRTAAVRNN